MTTLDKTALEARVKEVVAEAAIDGSGMWRSCSGCYETSDGYNVNGNPFSEAFGCIMGAGCHECGGIGAVWDTTDYAAMGEELSRDALSSIPAQPVGDGNAPLPFSRDELGRMVREAWVRWAATQPAPKPSWLVPYEELSEPDKEADRQIGEAISRWTVVGMASALGKDELRTVADEIMAGLVQLGRDPAAPSHPAAVAVTDEMVGDVLRCKICGFVIDTRYEAERPSVEFTMAGRTKPKDNGSLVAAARDLIASRSDTYRAGNNRQVGIQDESGEKMWIVPFDEMVALEVALLDRVNP